MDAATRAATNRSIRTIKTELDFLLDSDLLSAAQVAQIHTILPTPPSRADAARAAAAPASSGLPTPTSPPTAALAAAHLTPTASPQPMQPAHAPPPYSHPAAEPPALAQAEALYPYAPADAGDLALAARDRVAVAEFLNADWARGRNARTGAEGIFPRSYVRVLDEKSGGGHGADEKARPMPAVPGQQQPVARQETPYGNMPLEVAQGAPPAQGPPGAGGEAGPPSKAQQQGKKFGKKLGNAAIFGAGASIGSNIVNGIF